MRSEPTFFKVIWSSEKMEIPPAFVKKMQGSPGSRWVLRDTKERIWLVDVVKEGGNGWYLSKGWTKFYMEKCIEPCDVLLFEYRGDNVYDVRLLGSNACEKGEEANKSSRVKEGEEEFEEHNNVEGQEEKDQELDNNQENIYDDDEEDDEADHDYVKEEEGDDDNDDDDDDDEEGGGGGGDDDDDDDDDDGEEEDDNDDADAAADDDDDDDDFGDDDEKIRPKPRANNTFGAETIPNKRRYKKQNVPDCYGGDIFKSGLACRPQNPYFVTRSRTSRKNELYIPKDVIVDYHLKIPEKLFLVDGQGRKWETKVKQWKDGRLWCTSGWRSLCNVNNIEADDTCVCEFVQGRGCEKMCIRVRVVDGVGN